jgi:hypothetical protein
MHSAPLSILILKILKRRVKISYGDGERGGNDGDSDSGEDDGMVVIVEKKKVVIEIIAQY